jgi:glycosyltransferase involved in cell wall biosynthesis
MSVKPGDRVPLVSVVVAVRNGAATLARCLDSVPAGVELLVADGASTDGSAEILRQRAERVAWWCSEADTGVYAAWNKAVPRACGEWVLFLGADDWLTGAEGWSAVVAGLACVPADFGIAYGPVRLVALTGCELSIVGRPWEVAGPRFRREMSLPHQGVFHRRSLFAARGRFDESFRIAGDYEWLLRELLERPAWYLGDGRIVANMTVGGLSLHGTGILKHLREIRKAQERHGVHRPSLHYAARWMRAAAREAGNRVLGVRRAGWVADCVRRMTGRPPVWCVG